MRTWSEPTRAGSSVTFTVPVPAVRRPGVERRRDAHRSGLRRRLGRRLRLHEQRRHRQHHDRQSELGGDRAPQPGQVRRLRRQYPPGQVAQREQDQEDAGLDDQHPAVVGVEQRVPVPDLAPALVDAGGAEDADRDEGGRREAADERLAGAPHRHPIGSHIDRPRPADRAPRRPARPARRPTSPSPAGAARRPEAPARPASRCRSGRRPTTSAPAPTASAAPTPPTTCRARTEASASRVAIHDTSTPGRAEQDQPPGERRAEAGVQGRAQHVDVERAPDAEAAAVRALQQQRRDGAEQQREPAAADQQRAAAGRGPASGRRR